MGGLLFYVALAAFYGAVACAWFVAPIASRFGRVLLGSAQYGPDAILNASVLEWVYGSIGSSRHVFDFTASFPLSNSLAITENLFGWQLFYAPLRAAGVGIVASYNVVLLLSFVISGVGAAALCRRFGASCGGAVIGGFVFAFIPFHMSHSIHLQTLGVCWVPFALVFLDRLLDHARWTDALGFAAVFVMTTLSSIYFGVFLSIVTVLYVGACAAFGRYPLTVGRVALVVGSSVVSAMALSPVIIHYVRFAAAEGPYSHSPSFVAALSMELAGVIRVPKFQALWSTAPFMPNSNSATAVTWTTGFPGLIVVAIIAYWLIRVYKHQESRRVAAILLSIAIVCFLLALGPMLKIHGGLPAPGLKWVPMPGRIWLLFSTIRWPLRMYFFTVLMISVMASLGVTALLKRFSGSRRVWAVVALLLLVGFEYRPLDAFAQRSVPVPEPLAMSDAYRYLESDADRGAVAEIPTTDYKGRRAPMVTRYIYGSIGHKRRVVASHGSIVPGVTDSLETAIEEMPNRFAQEYLARYDVSRLVVHKSMLSVDSAAKLITALKASGLPVIFEGREGVVFRVTGSRKVY